MYWKALLLFVVLTIFAFGSLGAQASGGKNRLGDDEITEVYQLCQQLGVGDDTTITVEQCTNEDRCIVIKVDCSIDDPPPG